MNKKKTIRSITHQHPLTQSHLRTSIDTSPVAHSKLFNIRNSCRYQFIAITHSTNDLCCLLDLIKITTAEQNSVNTFFQYFYHQFRLLAVFNLNNQIITPASKKIFYRYDRPIEHPQNYYLILGYLCRPVFVFLVLDINKNNIPAGHNISAALDCLYRPQLPDLLAAAIRNYNRLCTALKRRYNYLFIKRIRINPVSFHPLDS